MSNVDGKFVGILMQCEKCFRATVSVHLHNTGITSLWLCNTCLILDGGYARYKLHVTQKGNWTKRPADPIPRV
jgi:hypothetical protein